MTTNFKPVKTSEEIAGNVYGIVKKHSRVDRYYSLSDGTTTVAKDFFSSLRGAKLAAKMLNAGEITVAELGSRNFDI